MPTHPICPLFIFLALRDKYLLKKGKKAFQLKSTIGFGAVCAKCLLDSWMVMQLL